MPAMSWPIRTPVPASSRINGSLATSGAGLPGYNTNLAFRRAEGIEVSANTGYDLGDWGMLDFSVNANY